jgi:phytoene dehydrogenase-like protein
MINKKVVIIGAGIAGLTAGCYARMNGYETQILESHTQPGGLCTTWTRRGYTFDGCIHWLTSSAPGDSLYTLWEELGAVQGRRMFDHDVFLRSVDVDGRSFSLYADPDRLEAHMKELSPADAAPIDELCDLIRRFRGFAMPIAKPRELMSPFDGLKMGIRYARYVRALKMLSDTRLCDFVKRFKDPLLAAGIAQGIGAEAPLLGLVMTLAPMARGAAGVPAGGSLAFARSIEARYTGLGGDITYAARVTRILEEDGRAVGVELADGSHVRADFVISAADLRATLHTLLDGSRQHKTHRVLMASGKLYDPCVQVSYGINRVFHELDECLWENLRLEQPLSIAGTRVEWIAAKSNAFDPTFAPEGCSVITSMLPGNWEYWNRLRADRVAYATEKEHVAATCADAINARYPGFKAAIEVTDVATPATFERYTGNWKGTFMTWLLTPEFTRRYGYVRKTVPGLDNLYIASMWTSPPGGVPGAAIAGREAVQLLCAMDKTPFVHAKP